jgi:hypothetical protein
MDESSLADQINYKFVTTNHNRIQQKILCWITFCFFKREKQRNEFKRLVGEGIVNYG